MKQLRLLMIGILIMNGCSTDNKEEVAVISTRFGDMIVELYPDAAPKHVESFKIHADNGYFNGTTFHRVIPGFVIQGGDPNSMDNDKLNDGQGGYAAKYYGYGDKTDSTTWTLPAEFNSHPHVTGTVSMARTPDPNSAGSQFFICAAPLHQLDNNYTVFGQVISGLNVLQQISDVPTDKRDNPEESVEMTVKLLPKNEALEK